MEDQGIALGVKQVPASQAIPGLPPPLFKPEVTPIKYPIVEELTFRALIQSEAQGYELLAGVQALVNEFGTETILGMFRKVAANPSLINKAKSFLPFL